MGVGGLSPQIAGQVRAAQIEAVRRYTPWMMATNIVIVAIIATTFRSSDVFAHVAVWSTFIILAAAYTLAVWWSRKHIAPPRSASLRGIRRTVLHTAILGFAWALLPALFFRYADDQQRLVIACVVAGMSCGSGFALATIPAAAILFSGILTAGGTLAVLTSPDVSTLVMLILNGIYFAVLIASSRSLSGLLRGRIEAQIRADDQRDYIGLLLNDFEEHGSDWLWMVDRHYRVIHVSTRLTEVLHTTENDLIGKRLTECLPLRDGGRYSNEDAQALRGLLRRMRKRRAFRDAEVAVRVGGQNRIWSLTARPVFDARGEFEGYRGVGRDVTIASEARRKIEYMARYDSLTGLPNRITLNDDIGRALHRLRERGSHFALLLLDLDHFKIINDTQGHPVGDALLKQAAERLQAAARGFGVVARFAGDEFAIVTNGLQNKRQAEDLAERIARHFQSPFALPGGMASVGVSIGIVYVASGKRDADTLIRHADLALYQAKDGGRGRHYFFEPGLDVAAKRRHQLEHDLRRALEHGGLELFYQPLTSAATGEVVAFEALMRWNHPTLGLLGPHEFIRLAEETGLIGRLGGWAIGQACRQALHWPPHIRIAVNLSPAQFQTPGLFDTVRRALEETGLDPRRLELEVTESLLLDTTGVVQATLQALDALRVRIVLDDFGTGYSSLGYLRQYRFHKLKVDRSFVEHIETEPGSVAIVKAVLGLARELGMTVAVEGVETQGQLAVLRGIGCDEIQGYLVSRPVTAGQTAALIHQQQVASA